MSIELQRPHPSSLEEMTKYHSDEYVMFLKNIRTDNYAEHNKHMQRCEWVGPFVKTQKVAPIRVTNSTDPDGASKRVLSVAVLAFKWMGRIVNFFFIFSKKTPYLSILRKKCSFWSGRCPIKQIYTIKDQFWDFWVEKLQSESGQFLAQSRGGVLHELWQGSGRGWRGRG